VRDPPGQRWEDFRHATDELVTVLEGEMKFEVAGKVHHPQVGEELLIPAGAVHLARPFCSCQVQLSSGAPPCAGEPLICGSRREEER